MKKLCCLLIMLLMPVIVNANSGPPSEIYEVIITNPEGTVLYDWEWQPRTDIGIVPYNTVLEVSGEYVINGVWYGYIDWLGESGFIKLNDTAINKNYSLEDAQEGKGQIYIYKEVNMYAGPSKKFDVLTTIPANITLNYNYLSSNYTLCYVTYNGHSGWVNIENTIYNYDNEDAYMTGVATVNIDPNYQIMIETNTVSLYSLPTYNSSSRTVTVSPNTLVEPMYTAVAEHYMHNWCYITINGISGWVEESRNNLPVIKESGHFITTSNELIVRSLNDLEASSIQVEPNTKLEYEYKSGYFYDQMTLYYIKYNNEYYWINTFDGTAAIYQIAQYQVEAENGLNLKKSPDETAESLNTTIPYKEIFSSIYYYNSYERDYENQKWVYITYQGTSGWINASANNISEISTTEPELEEDNDEVFENQKENIDKESKQDANLTPKLIIAICTLGVLIVAIIALVILMLINRKNKKNNVSN